MLISSKRYIVLSCTPFVDKYLLVVLMLLLAGAGIGAAKQEWSLFYTMIGGSIIVIIYNARQNRKKHDQEKNFEKKK